MYLLYFIAVVTLHATRAEWTFSRTTAICDPSKPFYSVTLEGANVTTASGWIECDRQITSFAINSFAAKFYEHKPSYWLGFSYSAFMIHASFVLAASVDNSDNRKAAIKDLGYLEPRYLCFFMRYKEFIDSVNRINSSVLNLRFKYFHHRDIKPTPMLIDRARRIFATEIQDFGGSLQEAKDNISDWFENETHYAAMLPSEKGTEDFVIRRLREQIDKETKLVIASAGYFNGALDRGLALDERASSYVSIDSPKNFYYLKYYYGEGVYRHGYLSDIKAKFIELPLKKIGSSPALSLLVIHPNKIEDCINVMNNLDSIDIENFLNAKMSSVKIRIPKIHFQNSLYFSNSVIVDPLTGFVPTDNHKFGKSKPSMRLSLQNIFVKVKSALGPGEHLQPLRSNDTFVEFNVNSTYIFAIILKEPAPIYLFIGRFW